MKFGLIAAAIMLVAVFCAGVVVLREDVRRRRIDRQLGVAVLASPGSQPGGTSLRLRTPREGRQGGFFATFGKLVKYDREARFIWSTSWVTVLASLTGIGAMIGCQMALPLWTSPAVGLLAGIATARGLFGWQRDRYASQLIRQMPDTIEVVIAAVRAGLPVTAAFQGVMREVPNPTHEQFKRVVSETGVGVSPEAALLNLYRRTGVSEYAMFSVTLAVQSKAGGQLAETLETLATAVRQRVSLAGRASALAGEAKLSAYVIGALPFISGLALLITRPDFLAPLVQDQRGRTLLSIGIGLLLLGILTMRRMIKRGTAV